MPGVSAVFLGSVVSYANDVKVAALGVDPTLLSRHGAVSEQVTAAMAQGACARLGARLCLSVSGIAGPGGGTPDKPVGTICFGLCLDGAVTTWTLRFPDLGREFLRERAAIELFAAILRHVH